MRYDAADEEAGMGDVKTWHGTVTDATVTIRSNRSKHRRWETVPIRQITGITSHVERHTQVAVAIAIAGVVYAIVNLSLGNLLLGVLAVAVGVLLWQGWPTIEVQTAGSDRLISRGLPWKHADAQQFEAAILARLHR